MFLVAIPVVVVLVAVGALVAVKLSGVGSGTTASGTSDSSVTVKATSVPAGVLDQVGVGTVRKAPTAIQAPALTADGKPKVLYVGAEYCPYCAAERWAVVVALSRFGTFSGLGQARSSARDVYPSTATLSFHGSSYTSSTIAFSGVETADEEQKPLDTLSPEDQQTFDTYDSPPYNDSPGSIPFIDMGGKYLSSGASFDPVVLKGKTQAEIAAALADPSSPIAQAVNGTANVITAAICATTKNAPAHVCNSAGVQAGKGKLG